ncbi:MAG: NAD(P)H-dependent oxidoreductase subunit E [Ignavibacteriae bacterium HGW-Ignavibacteriae-2]|jgi:[NiFe] hydrogenase diaphorase moiety large subunit|nr:NAD(P)H-dependent oxidoreductase subunit E [Bacteroidota bacterium]PKL88565.1 MAG: NAD(P)H-dependent oxidoreductase subunit E [Ignavibacteriae bacterium HGW-Ignavibacteriae-2]
MLVVEKNALTEEIESLVQRFGKDRSSLLKILHEIQKTHRHIPDFAQQEIARLLDIHPVEVYSVITFYAFLNTEPKGRNLVRVCKTITCDLQGKDAVCKAIERELGCKFGESSKDNKFYLEYANCLGLCDMGPAMAVNERVYTNLTPEKAVEILNGVK